MLCSTSEDYSIENPLLFKKNIVTAIQNDGYRGWININAFFGVKETITRELLDLYVEAGINSELFEGVYFLLSPSFLSFPL